MNTSKSVHRVLGYLALSLLLLGVWGCAAVPFDMSMETMFAPIAPSEDRQAKPITREPKPADAEDDSDLRHPHRWRKKLRAKFA